MPTSLAEEHVTAALKALNHIWNRWEREQDPEERERLWEWVQEAEKRVYLAKKAAGIILPGKCPECQGINMFSFKGDDGATAEVCRNCGWNLHEDLLKIIRDTVRRKK